MGVVCPKAETFQDKLFVYVDIVQIINIFCDKK